jgi:hypothetical protein
MTWCSGCVSVVGGQPTAGDARGPLSFGPDVAGSQLFLLLLTGGQVNKIMGVPTMSVVGDYHQLRDDRSNFSDQIRAGATEPAIPSAYDGKGYVAIDGRLHSDAPPDASGALVDQDVVSFPTA